MCIISRNFFLGDLVRVGWIQLKILEISQSLAEETHPRSELQATKQKEKLRPEAWICWMWFWFPENPLLRESFWGIGFIFWGVRLQQSPGNGRDDKGERRAAAIGGTACCSGRSAPGRRAKPSTPCSVVSTATQWVAAEKRKANGGAGRIPDWNGGLSKRLRFVWIVKGDVWHFYHFHIEIGNPKAPTGDLIFLDRTISGSEEQNISKLEEFQREMDSCQREAADCQRRIEDLERHEEARECSTVLLGVLEKVKSYA